MQDDHGDVQTIFALSTPLGKSGVAVVRISGSHAINAVRALGCEKELIPRYATYTKLFSYVDRDDLLDSALVLYFPAPHSFTGVDVVELQVHGSIAVINDLLHNLSMMKFIRPAGPGEFTKQALMNGKLDVVKVEALADLIHSETKMQKKLALMQFSGQLGVLYDNWRRVIVGIASRLEALIDFPEEYIPELALSDMLLSVRSLRVSIANQLERSKKAHVIEYGVTIAIVGPPNVGKSTLLNLLMQQDVSMVSEIAGTTRDVVRISREICGVRVMFYDTAGVRETVDVLEKEGIRRTKLAAMQANVVLVVFDVDSDMNDIKNTCDGLALKTFDHCMCIINKIDLLSGVALAERLLVVKNMIRDNLGNICSILDVSVDKVDGYDVIMRELEKIIRCYGLGEDDVLITSMRQTKALENCVHHMEMFEQKMEEGFNMDLAIQDLLYAAQEIEYVSGRGITMAEITDELFKNFCIGK